jgi:hypothetical protein
VTVKKVKNNLTDTFGFSLLTRRSRRRRRGKDGRGSGGSVLLRIDGAITAIAAQFIN